MMATPHIESNEKDIAPVVLMPGDPKRCEYIAKKYLANAKLINLVRGMTAYTGFYKNKMVTIFPSGMGLGSMGIYSYELFKFYNVNTIIRIGTCGAYVPYLKLKDIILVDNSISDSTFAMLQNGYNKKDIPASIQVNNLIEQVSKKNNLNIYRGNIYSSNVFYEEANNFQNRVNNYNVLGVEMETFALFHNAKVLGKNASALMTVTDSFCNPEKMDSGERERSLDTMITLALETVINL